MERVTHSFEPVFGGDSEVLILGTFPSVKSREGEFYYHHPQNRFWKVIAGITGSSVPKSVEEKKEMLLRNRIAVWDVIESCDITGSSDSSIKNVVPADLSVILGNVGIKKIFGNGNTAFRLYNKYCYPVIMREMVKLPSTSPANAAYSLDRLIEEWGVIKEYL